MWHTFFIDSPQCVWRMPPAPFKAPAHHARALSGIPHYLMVILDLTQLTIQINWRQKAFKNKEACHFYRYNRRFRLDD
jgi:hypothetical protein